MAVIDSKKLLPAGKPGGAIVESQKPFLVPVGNISYKKDINISQKLLKPADKELQQSGGSLVVIKKKVLQIKDIIGNTYLIEQNENNRKRKEKERQKAEEREKRLETKPKSKNDLSNLPKLSIPGGSILDTINRFLAFTFAGYLFDKYNKFLPKLLEFGKFISPVVKFIDSFGKNLIDGVINFIDLGYRTYDNVRKTIEQIGGKDAAKTFDEFSGHLNTLLNGAIAAAMLIASTSPKGVSGAAGAGAAGAVKAGVTPKPISGYGGGTAMTPGRYRLPGQARAGGFGLEMARKKATQTSLTQGAKGAATQGVKGAARLGVAGVPIIGALIGFVIDTVVFREKPTRAAAGAVGNALGAGLGAALAGAGTFGLGAGVGLFVGGFLGDIVGKSLYDAFTGYNPEPIKAKTQGGQVGGGQSRVSSTRRIRTQRISQRKAYIPPKTQPGKDIGGKLKIEGLYGKDEPGQRSALRALTKSSADLKGMKSMQGIAGGMFGAGIDMALGQKPDKKLADSLGSMFGSVIGAAINAELDSSFGDISKAIAMANGGVVPTRNIGSGISIGEKIGRYISNAFSIALESSASRVLRNLNQELNLEGGAPSQTSTDFDGGPGVVPTVSSDSADFWLLSLISLYENANPQGAADVAQSIYNRMAYSGRSAREIILAKNQYQPVGQYGSVSDWNKVVDKESALNHVKKFPGNAASVSALERVAASLLNKSNQQKAAIFVGNRPDFRSDSFEKSNNDMTDDTSRYGQTFGFNRGSSYKGKSIVAQRVPSLVRGNVQQPVAKGNVLSQSQTVLVEGNFRLRSDAAQAYLAMKASAKQDGINLSLESAWRDSSVQEKLYNLFLRGLGNLAAPPGYSNHEKGLAIDLRTGISWAQRNCSRFGWSNTGMTFSQKEPWHFEYVGGFVPKQNPKIAKLSNDIKNSIGSKGYDQSLIAPIQKSREIASLQQNPSYSQGGNMIIHDVNNIVMPLIPA